VSGWVGGGGGGGGGGLVLVVVVFRFSFWGHLFCKMNDDRVMLLSVSQKM
jgi:hypothetical protein